MRKLSLVKWLGIASLFLLIFSCTPIVDTDDIAPEMSVITGESKAFSSTAYYRIINRNSNKFLEVGGAQTNDGANVIQWSNTGSSCQEWKLQDIGGGYYRIINRNSNKYLEVGAAKTNDGANVIQWSNTGSSCQEWKLQDIGSGYYRIINRNSNKYLEVGSAKTNDGANVIQWSNTYHACQEWKIEQVGGTVPPPSYTYQSCDRWATFSDSGYTLYNNVWGLDNGGTQCFYGNSYKNWKVTANLPYVGHVTSYPNTSKDMNLYVDSMGKCTSSFNVTMPGSGDNITAYDIWYDNFNYEIMLWMNKTGNVGPIASSWDASGNPVADYWNQNIGGHTWNVYRGHNGGNIVYSFVRTSNTYSGTVDVKAISQWLRSKGWFGNVKLHRFQFGFEISATYRDLDFKLNDYSLSYY